MNTWKNIVDQLYKKVGEDEKTMLILEQKTQNGIKHKIVEDGYDTTYWKILAQVVPFDWTEVSEIPENHEGPHATLKYVAVTSCDSDKAINLEDTIPATLPSPTKEPQKFHFQNTNPRCIVVVLSTGIRVDPPVTYKEDFRLFMSQQKAAWNKFRWEIEGGNVAQAMKIVEKAFQYWDVEFDDSHETELSPLEAGPSDSEMKTYHRKNAVWFEHQEEITFDRALMYQK